MLIAAALTIEPIARNSARPIGGADLARLLMARDETLSEAKSRIQARLENQLLLRGRLQPFQSHAGALQPGRATVAPPTAREDSARREGSPPLIADNLRPTECAARQYCVREGGRLLVTLALLPIRSGPSGAGGRGARFERTRPTLVAASAQSASSPAI